MYNLATVSYSNLLFSRFKELFRLSKEAFVDLLSETEPFYKKTSRISAIPPILKLAAALRFFAEGGYQLGVGQDFHIGMSQPTISVVLEEVSNILNSQICPKYIKIPTRDQQADTKRYFYDKGRFPGIIGCVDGTHVKIITPSRNEHLFFNRKGYHSVNAMIVSFAN